MRGVYISISVMLLVAMVSASPQEGITIHITGPVNIIYANSVATAEQCSGDDGFCVETGDRCTGTLKILHKSCNDHCTCCVPDKQVSVKCEGQLQKIAGRCLYISQGGEEKTWSDASVHCKGLGGQLIADPSWEIAKYIRGNKDDCNMANDGWCGMGTWVAGFHARYEAWHWISSTNSSGYPNDDTEGQPITNINWYNRNDNIIDEENPDRMESDSSCLTMITMATEHFSNDHNVFFGDESCYNLFPYVCDVKFTDQESRITATRQPDRGFTTSRPDYYYSSRGPVMCEGEFQNVGGRCIYISKWGEDKTWYDAIIRCKDISAQLIVDPSWEIFKYLRDNKEDCNKANGGECGMGMWVAGFHGHYESWQWITSTNSAGNPLDFGKPITHINWDNHRTEENPDRMESDRSCLTMVTIYAESSWDNNVYFGDESCYNLFPFVCEKMQ